MDWKVAVLTLLFTIYVQVDALPVVTSNGQIVNGKINDVVALSCQVQDLGNYQLNWVFVKHMLTIFLGDNRTVINPRYSLLHPPGSNTYSLQISNVTLLDQGVYKCEVDGTNKSTTVELHVIDSPVPPEEEYEPDRPLNRTGCCQQRGVSSACLPACSSSSAPANMNYITACANDVPNLVYCGSDGRNHENCCAQRGVPSGCLFLCSNDPLKMPTISAAQLYCLNFTQTILSCYEYGGALIPSAPQSLSVLSHTNDDKTVQLLISWKKPMYNPEAAIGYLVHYKKTTETNFISDLLLDSATRQYKLNADTGEVYNIYVVAVGHHGSSQRSDLITVVAQDTFSDQHATNVYLCCQQRDVQGDCLGLCQSGGNFWATFNVNIMLKCYTSLTDVFQCLAGERNHATCCRNNLVPETCVGMCSGTPPPFNETLAMCIPKLPFIESCVQQGLSTQTRAPQGLGLGTVTADSAMVTWADPSTTGNEPVDRYFVDLRRGNENAAWLTVEEVVGTSVELTNLTESENYAVRVIAEIGNISSLPSAVISFTTLPATTPALRPTVSHDFKKCCEDSGMPFNCSEGCEYVPHMTKYYAPRLKECAMHIGTVLTCAADGRDHTPCCLERDVKEDCHPMCVLNAPGPLNPNFLTCLNDTYKIVLCFGEGVINSSNLVRMPEDVRVTNVSSHTITIQWNNPETGPTPERYDIFVKGPGLQITRKTTAHVIVLQNLMSSTMYNISIKSFLNESYSPPTAEQTVFTPAVGDTGPYVPLLPNVTSRALWNNRTHCCTSSGISEACQPLCLNQPTITPVDCRAEDLKILACAADGGDHSLCCQSAGLTKECVSLCSGRAISDFTVRQAGCLAEDSLTIIQSCYLANSGLVPTAPKNFVIHHGYREVPNVNVEWSDAENCNGSCSYDVHYWKTYTDEPSDYTTVFDQTSPHVVTGLKIGTKYTFTVTARNDKGSGPPTPWQTLYFGIMRPDVSIAQRPTGDIYDERTDVTLYCEIFNVQDIVSYTWQLREHVLESSGKLLVLNNVDRTSEGIYSCTVSVADFTGTAHTYVNVRYKPEFNFFRTDSAPPNVDAQAVIEFWFRGHPDSQDFSKVWTKDGNHVQQSERYSMSAQTFLQTGITSFKLKIDDVEPSDYGTFQCHVENQFGSAVAVTKLIDPERLATPIPPSPEQKKNTTRCCEERQIIDTCMPLCTLEVSTAEAVKNPDRFEICLFFLKDFVECAADGGDHTLCCEKKVVSDKCLPFCKGEVLPVNDVPHMLDCATETPKIIECMETGFEKIPTAPLSLAATVEGNTILVTWTKPERNAEDVTGYTVYYNYTGHPQYKKVAVTSLIGYSYKLKVNAGHTYNIWMTAEAQNVGRSQVSAMLSVQVPGPEEEEKLNGGAIAGIVIGVLALIAIIALVVFLVRRQNTGKQKLVESVTYDNSSSYDNAGIHISNPYDKF